VTLAPLQEAPVVDNDPAQALLAAQAEGLLAYRGFVSGNRYEVVAAGRHWTMSAADALLTVARLRAVAQLVGSAAPVELVEIRADGGYSLLVAGKMMLLAEPDVLHWCEGFLAGLAGNGQSHAGADTMSEIADLLESPSRDDQCRMIILGLMYGGEKPIKVPELARMIGELPGVGSAPGTKTVGGALSFGGYMSSEIAEQMVAAFGQRWVVTTSGAAVEVSGGKTMPLPEMPGLVRLRELVKASKKRWLRYLDKQSPNEARWLTEYRVSVGQREYVVTSKAFEPWLRGLEAFHAAGVRPPAPAGPASPFAAG
jgi:hypothetical protein